MIQFISDWALDPTGAQNILWLHGLAGSGKSTLSTTIANRFRETGHLGAFIFFDRDIAERSDPTTVIRTLAYQLGSFHTRAGLAISAALETFPSIRLSPLRIQFQQLLVDPLSPEGVLDANAPIVIVLDALDECGCPKKRAALLEILADQFVRLPSAIRVVITSRLEHDIKCAFERRDHIHGQELDITSDVNANDISYYLRHKMIHVRSKAKDYLPLGSNWPSEEDLQQLAERASGLFVWASTASQFIDGYDPIKRMDTILKRETSLGAEYALDGLYRTALESVGNWDDEDFLVDFRAVMGLVLVARRPLSGSAIDCLLSSPGRRQCMYTTSHLGCVVQQHPTIRLLHPSFADFLLTRSRCGRDIWFFDQVAHNHALALHCLRRLEEVLKRNICNLTLSANLDDESLPEDLTYACVFWVDHMCAVKDDIQSIMDRLDAFLCRHLLHWFEAMSILRRSRDTIVLLSNLSAWITVSFS
jgi:hypothetical protein